MIISIFVAVMIVLGGIALVLATDIGRWLKRALAIALALFLATALIGGLQAIFISWIALGAAALVLGSRTFWKISFWGAKGLLALRAARASARDDARHTIRHPVAPPSAAPADVLPSSTRSDRVPRSPSPWVQ